MDGVASSDPPPPQLTEGVEASSVPSPPQSMEGVEASSRPPPPQSIEGVEASSRPPPPQSIEGVEASSRPPPPQSIEGVEASSCPVVVPRPPEFDDIYNDEDWADLHEETRHELVAFVNLKVEETEDDGRIHDIIVGGGDFNYPPTPLVLPDDFEGPIDSLGQPWRIFTDPDAVCQLLDIAEEYHWNMEQVERDAMLEGRHFAKSPAYGLKDGKIEASTGWENTDDFKMEHTRSGGMFKLPGRIFMMLYPHQQEGIRWLWSLHCRGTGGVLGDASGLGKTMQVSAFLAGLFHSRLIKRALVVAPKTSVTHWIKELSVVGLKDKTRDYSGSCINVQDSELIQYAFKEGGILVTTYDIAVNKYKLIRGDFCDVADYDDEGKLWNYVILDEGHIIQNMKKEMTRSLLTICCVHRIVVSGKPIQNNLKEMWALFHLCCPKLLGRREEFKTRYELPILQGNDKNATKLQKKTGLKVAKKLTERIKPYRLHRLKREVFLNTSSTYDKKLPNMTELFIWLKLTASQKAFYESAMDLGQPEGSSPSFLFKRLKEICDHVQLLRMPEDPSDAEVLLQRVKVCQDGSCKLSFIISLLRNLVEEEYHILIFSHSLGMLNFIEKAILLEGHKCLRIDETTKVSKRISIVKNFHEGPGAQILLLAGQFSWLRFTKADRIIIVDSLSGNQSAECAFEIRQPKVIVYRLMTCGTIEEKVFNSIMSLMEQNVQFKETDTQELSSLPENSFDVSLTQKQWQEENGQQLVMDKALSEHIRFLEQQGIAGVSQHSHLLSSKTATYPTMSEIDVVDSHLQASCYVGNRCFWVKLEGLEGVRAKVGCQASLMRSVVLA